MIQISNSDRDLIVRYIEEMYAQHQPKGLRDSNLQRRAHVLAKKLKAKKSITSK